MRNRKGRNRIGMEGKMKGKEITGPQKHVASHLRGFVAKKLMATLFVGLVGILKGWRGLGKGRDVSPQKHARFSYTWMLQRN